MRRGNLHRLNDHRRPRFHKQNHKTLVSAGLDGLHQRLSNDPAGTCWRVLDGKGLVFDQSAILADPVRTVAVLEVDGCLVERRIVRQVLEVQTEVIGLRDGEPIGSSLLWESAFAYLRDFPSMITEEHGGSEGRITLNATGPRLVSPSTTMKAMPTFATGSADLFITLSRPSPFWPLPTQNETRAACSRCFSSACSRDCSSWSAATRALQIVPTAVVTRPPMLATIVTTAPKVSRLSRPKLKPLSGSSVRSRARTRIGAGRCLVNLSLVRLCAPSCGTRPLPGISVHRTQGGRGWLPL